MWANVAQLLARRPTVLFVVLVGLLFLASRHSGSFVLPSFHARSQTSITTPHPRPTYEAEHDVVYDVGADDAYEGAEGEEDVPLPPVKPPPSRYPAVPLVLLSTDLHISLIADIKDLVSRHFPNITIRDESLSGSCGSMGSCATNIQVVSRSDTHFNIYASNTLKRNFFDHYREGSASGDRFVLESDVVHCSHPTGMCELYMPLNKSMILWASTRFEQGREFDKHRFSGFVHNFRAMAAQPGTAVMANSVYDQMYVYYFTGIMPQYVPSYCAYPGVLSSWTGVDRTQEHSFTILAHGYRPKYGDPGSLEHFMAPALQLLAEANSSFAIKHLRAFYGHYSYADLARHPAIIYFPYQVSVMSFFEQYRMGIPLIVPGIKLLTQWQLKYGMLSERTWDMVFLNRRSVGSVIPKYPGVNIPFDPNDEQHADAVEYWLQFSDFYKFPHVLTFESWQELVTIITTTDLKKQSKLIQDANKVIERDIVDKWRGVFQNVIPQWTRPSMAGYSYDDAMNAIFGKGNWTDY